MPKGYYWDFYKTVFSPNFPILQLNDYNNNIVLFKNLIFHLESSAALIHPSVSNPLPLRCIRSNLFMSYRKHVLNSFHLYNIDPPPIPMITFIIRKRTNYNNIGRIIENENEIINIINKGNMLNYQIVDFSLLSIAEQIKIIRNTNILIGAHGAGLMNIMYAADESILIEIHPSYRVDYHFRHAARMVGSIYMPIRSQIRESCIKTSDNIIVPINEFYNTLDNAVRIARSFDKGISECGLICPGSILAIDYRLDPFYKQFNMTKSDPIDMTFPCI